MSEQSKNCSFEISFNDVASPASTRSPLAKLQQRAQDSPKRDVKEKVEEANKRRSELLQVSGLIIAEKR